MKNPVGLKKKLNIIEEWKNIIKASDTSIEGMIQREDVTNTFVKWLTSSIDEDISKIEKDLNNADETLAKDIQISATDSSDPTLDIGEADQKDAEEKLDKAIKACELTLNELKSNQITYKANEEKCKLEIARHYKLPYSLSTLPSTEKYVEFIRELYVKKDSNFVLDIPDNNISEFKQYIELPIDHEEILVRK